MEMKPLCDLCAHAGRESIMVPDAVIATCVEAGRIINPAQGYAYFCIEHDRFYHPARGYFSNEGVPPLVEYCGQEHCTFAKHIALAPYSLPETWIFQCFGDHPQDVPTEPTVS